MMNQAVPPSSALPSSSPPPSLHSKAPPAERRRSQASESISFDNDKLFATKGQTQPVKNAIAGACAGAFAKTVVAPIERVKLLMQLKFSIDSPSTKLVGSGAASGDTTTTATTKTTTSSSSFIGQGTKSNYSAWEVAKKVYERQGILAFWRGM